MSDIPGEAISTTTVEIDLTTAGRLDEMVEGYKAWAGRDVSRAEYLSWLIVREHWDCFKASARVRPRNQQ